MAMIESRTSTVSSAMANNVPTPLDQDLENDESCHTVQIRSHMVASSTLPKAWGHLSELLGRSDRLWFHFCDHPFYGSATRFRKGWATWTKIGTKYNFPCSILWASDCDSFWATPHNQLLLDRIHTIESTSRPQNYCHHFVPTLDKTSLEKPKATFLPLPDTLYLHRALEFVNRWKCVVNLRAPSWESDFVWWVE